MTSVQPIPQITFDDWLQGERAAIEGRSEYVAGEVFAMAGGSEEHNLIVTNHDTHQRYAPGASG